MANLLNVLVVEDNVINQKVVVKMLARMKITPALAVNGKEAVRMFSEKPYDLIFMDVQMPEMDGLEATKEIRSIESIERTGSHSIIIALTANAMQGDRERCLQSGMDDYLAKPIKQIDLETVIEKWLPEFPIGSLESFQRNGVASQNIIDPERIQQIQEIGDDALLKELLSLYLEDLDQFASIITAAIHAENFQQIYESAHKLKGSSANLGISSISEACLSMESLAKQNNGPGVAGQFTAMQESMKSIRAYITKTYF